MAMLPTEAFDIEVEEKKEYPPIPAGDYSVVIKEAELKDTMKGGMRVAVRYEIEAGALAGRLVFDSLNIINKGDNAKITEQIARRKLHQIFEAIGTSRAFMLRRSSQNSKRVEKVRVARRGASRLLGHLLCFSMT